MLLADIATGKWSFAARHCNALLVVAETWSFAGRRRNDCLNLWFPKHLLPSPPSASSSRFCFSFVPFSLHSLTVCSATNHQSLIQTPRASDYMRQRPNRIYWESILSWPSPFNVPVSLSRCLCLSPALSLSRFLRPPLSSPPSFPRRRLKSPDARAPPIGRLLKTAEYVHLVYGMIRPKMPSVARCAGCHERRWRAKMPFVGWCSCADAKMEAARWQQLKRCPIQTTTTAVWKEKTKLSKRNMASCWHTWSMLTHVIDVDTRDRCCCTWSMLTHVFDVDTRDRCWHTWSMLTHVIILVICQ